MLFRSLRMHAILARFTHAVRAEGGERDRDVWLALTILHKRALSSAYALEQSVLRRLAMLAPCPEKEQQLGLPLDEHIANVVEAMRPIAGELGLRTG